jgi:bifunctional non-homologous end joining protein LigD
VLTDRTLKQIATDADRVWSTGGKAAANSKTKSTKRANAKVVAKTSTLKKNAAVKRSPLTTKELAKLTGARRAKQPTRVSPQLATLVNRVPEGDAWLHEVKFDGYRAVSFIENGKVRLVSRNGNDWTARFQVVADALETLPIRRAILDGEVVALDDNGLSSFQLLQNQMKRGDDASLVEYLFDMPYCEGYDLTKTPLVERKEALARLILSANPRNDGPFRYSDHIPGQGENVLQNACQSGMEGIISKRADSGYQEHRSTSWLKIKCLKQQEFVIGGYSAPKGSRVGFGALLLGYYDDDLIYAGRVGTGFTTQSLRDLTAELKKRRIDSPPFETPLTGSERRGVTWVKPELVAEV